MSPAPALPELHAIPGALSAADIGQLVDQTIGANVSVVSRDSRIRYVNAHYARTHATTQDTLIGHLDRIDSVWHTVSLSPRRDDTGELVGTVPVSMREHELKVKSEALRSAHERLTLHMDNNMDNTPLAIVELDKNLNIASCSTQFRSLIGADAAAVTNASIFVALGADSGLVPLAQAFEPLQSGREVRNRVEAPLRRA